MIPTNEQLQTSIKYLQFQKDAGNELYDTSIEYLLDTATELIQLRDDHAALQSRIAELTMPEEVREAIIYGMSCHMDTLPKVDLPSNQRALDWLKGAK